MWIYKVIQDNSAKSKRSWDLSFAESALKILPNVVLKESLWKQDETIVFIHPPKTAGTNIVYLVEAISAIKPEVTIKRAAVPRIPGRSPGLFTDGSLGGLSRIISSPSEFQGKEGRLKFISGHMPVPEISNDSILFGLNKVTYIALIRNPIDREISSTNFDYQRGFIERRKAISYLLEEAIDNLQTRLLAGQNSMSGKCTASTLEKAKNNIKARFKFVAPTEDVEIVMGVIAGHFGITDIAYSQAQVTGIKALDSHEPELLKQLAEKHKYDLELYNWIKTEWDVWKKQHIESVSTSLSPNKRYLAIKSDFAKNKTPYLMSAQDINAYNIDHYGLTVVQQSHSGLTSSDKTIIKSDNCCSKTH